AKPPAETRDRREARRPRHTKPRVRHGPRTKLVAGAGRRHGLEPKDLIGALVDHSRLEGEDVQNVRVLERFSFAEVPADRAEEVVAKLSRAVDYDVEVAKR
ncbi:MAG: DbpA RNA binding domain-containing protein, partial [Actinomycetota bacterium]|nr:DbpA RNA binding domain-containing protein [Actinomycetota bacterium]